MTEEIKCPKCGNAEFLVRIFVDLKIDPNRNFGNVKYDWIEKCMCGNIACGYVLEGPDEDIIKNKLLLITKSIITSMKEETLIIK